MFNDVFLENSTPREEKSQKKNESIVFDNVIMFWMKNFFFFLATVNWHSNMSDYFTAICNGTNDSD